jgi:hypothetical protein
MTTLEPKQVAFYRVEGRRYIEVEVYAISYSKQEVV